MTVYVNDLPEVPASFSDDYLIGSEPIDLDEFAYELGMELDFED